MALGPSGRRNEPLHVLWIAAALVVAAFLGAALGVLWHAAGFGNEDETPAAQSSD